MLTLSSKSLHSVASLLRHALPNTSVGASATIAVALAEGGLSLRMSTVKGQVDVVLGDVSSVLGEVKTFPARMILDVLSNFTRTTAILSMDDSFHLRDADASTHIHFQVQALESQPVPVIDLPEQTLVTGGESLLRSIASFADLTDTDSMTSAVLSGVHVKGLAEGSIVVQGTDGKRAGRITVTEGISDVNAMGVTISGSSISLLKNLIPLQGATRLLVDDDRLVTVTTGEFGQVVLALRLVQGAYPATQLEQALLGESSTLATIEIALIQEALRVVDTVSDRSVPSIKLVIRNGVVFLESGLGPQVNAAGMAIGESDVSDMCILLSSQHLKRVLKVLVSAGNSSFTWGKGATAYSTYLRGETAGHFLIMLIAAGEGPSMPVSQAA